MKTLIIASAIALGCTGCVAGPGGSNNAANRTITGAAIGAAVGGLAGSAVADPLSGAVVGAVAGGALGAAVNPNHVFRPDTRGYCYMVDAQVGPIVMLAAGGVLAEVHRDRSIRLAPVDIESAREMIEEVAAFKALRGYRGRAPGDLEALATAVVAMSRLAEDATVIEAEINPLIVMEEGRGIVAVDALVRVMT